MWDQAWDDGNSEHGTGYEMALDNVDNFYIVGIQQQASVTPAYCNRYRALIQYRDGQDGCPDYFLTILFMYSNFAHCALM